MSKTISNSKTRKFIFVMGGVMSGVGKGIATASLGTVLQAKGYRVNLTKVDPYLNVDAGTMNPIEHGETFVLDSGLETDQDMGNYERFLGRSLRPGDYITSGMIYKHVIDKERALGYGGRTVEAIPHVTDEIIRRIMSAAEAEDADISIIEVGGTIGDFQNALFIEAARIMKRTAPADVMTILVSYLPVPGTLGEMKTRPTQHAIQQLNTYGLQADMIIARSTHALDARRKEKIAVATSVQADYIISAPDIESIYDVPLNFSKDKIDEKVIHILGLRNRKSTEGLAPWRAFAKKVKSGKKPLRIAIVGKYFTTGNFVLADAYVSVIEAVKYSSYAAGAKLELDFVASKDFENKAALKRLSTYDGIIVPGGFGESGISGKIAVVQYCREKKIPCLGLCYGMQLMVVEYARNVLGLKQAHTTEIDDDTPHPVIHIMPDQEKKLLKLQYGGTMRLGAYPAKLTAGSIAQKAYGTDKISERHRHRYEVNNAFRVDLENAGLHFSGTSPDGKLCEIAELSKKDHPFFLGTQFHPELKARPLNPHPLFNSFIKAALARRT